MCDIFPIWPSGHRNQLHSCRPRKGSPLFADYKTFSAAGRCRSYPPDLDVFGVIVRVGVVIWRGVGL